MCFRYHVIITVACRVVLVGRVRDRRYIQTKTRTKRPKFHFTYLPPPLIVITISLELNHRQHRSSFVLTLPRHRDLRMSPKSDVLLVIDRRTYTIHPNFRIANILRRYQSNCVLPLTQKILENNAYCCKLVIRTITIRIHYRHKRVYKEGGKGPKPPKLKKN